MKHWLRVLTTALAACLMFQAYAQSPFACQGGLFIIGDPPPFSQLYEIDRSGPSYAFTPIGPPTSGGGYPTAFQVNALSFNPEDFFYATVTNPNNNRLHFAADELDRGDIVIIDKFGQV